MGEQEQIDKILVILGQLAKSEALNVELLLSFKETLKELNKRITAIENHIQLESKLKEIRPLEKNRFDL